MATLEDDDDQYFEEDNESFVNTFGPLFEMGQDPAPGPDNSATSPPPVQLPELEVWNIYAGHATGTFMNR